MKEVILELTTLEIIFVGTTLVFGFFNILQWRDSRKLKSTIYNPVVALFNDIKSKQNNTFLIQQLIYSPKNPHKDLDTLKLDYYEFTNSVIGFLNGFQESVVGLLVTLKDEDREGKEIFKAANFGLTEQDKRIRDEYMKRLTTQISETKKTQSS
ncbi:hypothetical protein MYX76_04370 [Desulfobacterota bacterium AH_259_B03_O07]|nr:hypothetical protein [Desulfobacterota bacterium AH_259_B03_O07]